MLKEVCSKERDRNRCQVKIPGINLGLQEKRRGIRWDPLHIIGDPSAVKRWTLLSEDNLGPGNTETEALESTRNSRSEIISFTNRRVELQNSSGAEAI